jgi:DNA repair and recombination protein RAD52
MAPEQPTVLRLRRLSTAAKRKLRQPLAPEHISDRRGDDGELVRYLEGWRAIQLANAIFGEDRWGAEVVGEVAYRPLTQTGRRGATLVQGIYTATVRVTVDGCTAHSDVGTAPVTEQTPEAHALACKAAVTDGLKRALRHFGAALGNELYDLDPAAAVDELRSQVIAIAERGGSDETRTREWIEARYGCPLDRLDRIRLEEAVSVLSRGVHRQGGAHEAQDAA